MFVRRIGKETVYSVSRLPHCHPQTSLTVQRDARTLTPPSPDCCCCCDDAGPDEEDGPALLLLEDEDTEGFDSSRSP